MNAIVCIVAFIIGNMLSCNYRFAGSDIMAMLDTFSFRLGLEPMDMLVGVLTAVVVQMLMYVQRSEKKNLRRTGEEFGSARFGTSADIAPYMDLKDPTNNVILTKTEGLTMASRPAGGFEYARNKNILIMGGSGSGKTRSIGKPNLMQMHSSYVYTDPKGSVLEECGKMLLRGRPISKDKDGKTVYEPYKVKVFNTIDFEKSMHYNPFAYISEKNCEADILRFVDLLIMNTNGKKQSGGDDFWEKSEKLLYYAYIGMIFCLCPKEERNFRTLVKMISLSTVREDDESYKNAVDLQFEAVEAWLSENDEWFEEDEIHSQFAEDFFAPPTDFERKLGNFAILQYKNFKLAAGKTAKSILVSVAVRLAPIATDDVLEVTSTDEMELDKLGDELTALFVIVPDTNETFNFLVAIMYSQLFNILVDKADKSPKHRLDHHVRFMLDEFANIGQIPNFEKLIATIRSREISATIILQTKSQLKAIYKDSAETIEGNCDSQLFLGGTEKTTLKELSEDLGNETIDFFTTGRSRGRDDTSSVNYSKQGRALKTVDELETMAGNSCILKVRGLHPFFSRKYDITAHPMYGCIADSNENNRLDIDKYLENYRKRKPNISSKQDYSAYEVKIG